MMSWPDTSEKLAQLQAELAEIHPEPWLRSGDLERVAGCFICFETDGGSRAWAAASLMKIASRPVSAICEGEVVDPYVPGFLAMREGSLLDQAVRALTEMPEILMVNATGRDHPRRAGLAFHIGAVLDLPTVGVTDRPLIAEGRVPGERRGSQSPLTIDNEVVAIWVRTRTGVRPVVAHAGWRTDARIAAEVVLETCGKHRTPRPIRWARREARAARGRALAKSA